MFPDEPDSTQSRVTAASTYIQVAVNFYTSLRPENMQTEPTVAMQNVVAFYRNKHKCIDIIDK